MEYIYAALLLHKAGKPINEENLKKILEATGISYNDAKAKSFVESLKDVNIEEVISKPQVATTPAKETQKPEAKEEKKKPKEEKKSEEDAIAGLGSLFG